MILGGLRGQGDELMGKGKTFPHIVSGIQSTMVK